MSRADVLVDADWVEAHLDDPKRRPRRGRRGHQPPTTRATSPAPSASTGRPTCRTRSAATSSTRRSSRRCCPRKGIGNDDTVVLYGGNNNWFAAYAYWYFKLYGHEDVKLLDGGRKKWELDSRELVDRRAPTRAATTYTAQGAGHLDPRLPRRRRRRDRLAEPGRRALARRVRRPAARPGAPAAGAVAARAATSRRRANIPWSKAANDDGTFESDDELTALYADAGVDLGQGHHRVLPHRRALGAHLVRAARAARPAEREELRRLVDRVRLARRRAGRSSATSRAAPKAAPDVRRDQGRPVASRAST